MKSRTFTPSDQCPETLNQQALHLSFQILRTEHPALALRIRNAITASSELQPLASSILPASCVHDIVTALSQQSKNLDLAVEPHDLVTLRKLLLIWMEYESQRQKK